MNNDSVSIFIDYDVLASDNKELSWDNVKEDESIKLKVVKK